MNYVNNCIYRVAVTLQSFIKNDSLQIVNRLLCGDLTRDLS